MHMQRKLIALLLLALWIVCGNAHGSDANPNKGVKFQVTQFKDSIELTLAGLDYSLEKDGEYDAIRIEAGHTYRSAADPELPIIPVKILLPPEADLSTVRMSMTGKKQKLLNGTFNLKPSPPPRKDDTEQVPPNWSAEGKVVENGKNILVYQNESFFPADDIRPISTSRLRKYKLAVFPFFPFQFNPVQGSLRVTEQIKIKIEFTPSDAELADFKKKGTDDFLKSGVADAANYDQMIAAYQVAPAAKTKGSASGPDIIIEPMTLESIDPADYDYMIVTTDYIATSYPGEGTTLADFEDFKESQGYRVVTVVGDGYYDDLDGTKQTSDGWGGGTGDTACNNLRNYLLDYYNSTGGSNLHYVLLVGDPNPGDSDADIAVPMKQVQPVYSTGTPSWTEVTYTDKYYCLLSQNPADLNWDITSTHGIGCFQDGEKSSTYTPEVTLGRLPIYHDDAYWVDTHPVNELQDQLAKIISYSSTTGDTSWRRNVFLGMQFQFLDNIGGMYGEWFTRSIFRSKTGWSTSRVYPDEWEQYANDVYKIWRDTTNHLVPVFYGYDAGVYITDAWGSDYALTTTEWNDRDFGISVLHSHGSHDLVSGGFCSSDHYSSYYPANCTDHNQCKDLDDAHPSFCFINACNVAKPNANHSPMAAELMYQGSIGVVAFTCAPSCNHGEYPYASYNVCDCKSDGIGWDWIRRLSQYQRGADALNDVLIYEYYNDDMSWLNVLGATYFGDPTTRMSDNMIASAFELNDDTGGAVARVNENGDLNLIDDWNVNTSLDPIQPPAGVSTWTIRDDTGEIVAMVETSGSNCGHLTLKHGGGCAELSTPSSSHLFYIKDDSGTPVLSITQYGQLYLKGVVTKNCTIGCFN